MVIVFLEESVIQFYVSNRAYYTKNDKLLY